MYTEDQVRAKIEEHESFIEYVAKVFNKYITATEGSSYLNTGSIYFEEDYVCGGGDEFWNYGGHEYHSYSMPIKYLWSNIDYECRILEAQVKQAEIDKKQKEADAKIEKDRKLYEQLKEQFGD